MSVFNDTCTLYNRCRDGENGLQWYRTALCGINIDIQSKAVVDDKGLVTANSVSVTIPIQADSGGKPYLPRKEWEALEDKAAAWTMQEGDLLLPGIWPLELGGTFRETQLREAAGRVYTIYSYDDNLKGSPRVQNYCMEAK